MTCETMTSETFARLLDTYGANAARWPTAERAAAEALLADSADAQALLAAAAALDDALRAAPKAPAGLVDRILAASGAERGVKVKRSAP